MTTDKIRRMHYDQTNIVISDKIQTTKLVFLLDRPTLKLMWSDHNCILIIFSGMILSKGLLIYYIIQTPTSPKSSTNIILSNPFPRT